MSKSHIGECECGSQLFTRKTAARGICNACARFKENRLNALLRKTTQQIDKECAWEELDSLVSDRIGVTVGDPDIIKFRHIRPDRKSDDWRMQ